jgi:two-component system OmpR family response regulator
MTPTLRLDRRSDTWNGEKTMNEGSRRVLVVEDDPVIRMLIVATLQDAGLDVLEAASGSEALLLMQDPDHVDLILTDLNMPEPDGAEVATRARTQHPRIPVLFVTGRPDLLAVRRPPRPYRHLTKPFRMAQISETVDEMLNHA